MATLDPEPEPRCVHTGGQGQCIGHWDYWGDRMQFTRHFPRPFAIRSFVITYDHCAPEVQWRSVTATRGHDQ